MEIIYLLLGSNLGNRETYLENSRKLIQNEIGLIIEVSSLFETASWGETEQPDFINQVVIIKSTLSPQEVLEKIISIETKLGRVREEKWGSRVIDIDILFYSDEIINEKELVIPHPFLHQRRFVLEPLMELKPNLKHPVLGKTITELYNSLSDNLPVKRITN